MGRLVGVLATVLFLYAPAQAQELAGSFDQLRVLVKPGDTIAITDNGGQTVQGKLTALGGSALKIDVMGISRDFEERDIDTIRAKRSDPLKNGALIGLVAGAGLGALAMGATIDNPGAAFVGGLIYGGVGAGIGAGIDALIEGLRVIYARRVGPTNATVATLPRSRHDSGR